MTTASQMGTRAKRPAVKPMVRVEIFRTGAHVAADGSSLSVNRADLSEAARHYDPALHEAPIVFGHPVDDAAPAHGWVAGLAAEGDRLVAELTDVSDALKGLVRQGAYRKVSAAFYRPDAPANPTPGALHLHHVGVLGAVPPAVKGLQPIQFADEAAHLLTFAGIDVDTDENDPRRAKSLTARLWGMLRGMLEKPGVMDQLEDIIVAEGADLARAALSNLSDALSDPQENKTRSNEAAPSEEAPEPAAAPPVEESAEQPADAAPVDGASDKAAEKEEEDVAINGAVSDLGTDLGAGLTGRLSFAEYEARLRRRLSNEKLVDQLIAKGRFASGKREDTLAFMESLNTRDDTIAFSEGREESALTYFRDLLKDLPPLVAFAEVAAAPQEPVARNADLALPKGTQVDPEGLTLHAKAEAIRRSNPSTSYLAAVAEAAKAG